MGKSEVNLPQMPPNSGGIRMGVDSINHRFAPGLPPGWTENLSPTSPPSRPAVKRSLPLNSLCLSTAVQDLFLLKTRVRTPERNPDFTTGLPRS